MRKQINKGERGDGNVKQQSLKDETNIRIIIRIKYSGMKDSRTKKDVNKRGTKQDRLRNGCRTRGDLTVKKENGKRYEELSEG